MSIFDHRRPARSQPAKDVLQTLRETLERLNSAAEETPRTADLKRILASRIAELERKSA
jgi:hypothetical protein